MKLFLVRHGETDANRILGHGVVGPMHDESIIFKPGDDTNISLNVFGRNHATEAAKELPDNISEIYASPLLRAKETAEIIAEIKKINPATIQFRDELTEYHQSSLEGLSTEEKKERLGGQLWGSGMLCNYDYSPWEGDTWETIHDRVSSLIEELKSKGDDRNIVCVTSGGVIRMAYKIFLWDKSPEITKHIVIHNGSVHQFIID